MCQVFSWPTSVFQCLQDKEKKKKLRKKKAKEQKEKEAREAEEAQLKAAAEAAAAASLDDVLLNGDIHSDNLLTNGASLSQATSGEFTR